MSKNTNLSFLTDFLTADIVNSRVGMNNVSPQSTFDVTGTGKFSGILTLGSTVSNGTYTYTLPSATGTLALTSDIPSVSGYVPYTGANQSVDLGNNVLTSRGLNIDSIGGTAGALNLRQATSFSTWSGAPFTSIYATTGNRVVFSFSNDNRSFTLDGSLVSAASPRTFTFPDATGTLALTSDIPSVVGVYLPLAGGTLTGALNGTSATFSGLITYSGTSQILNAASGTTGYLYQYLANTTGAAYFGLERSTGGGLFTGSSAYATVLGSATATSLEFGTNGIIRLTIASTGAATFSSTLLTGGDITVSKSGDAGINVNTTTTNGVAVTRYQTTAAGNLWATGINITNSDSRWEIYNFALAVSPFRISTTGAATFSNDIQGGGDLYFNKATRTTIYPTTSNQNLHIKSNGTGKLQFNDDVTGNINMVVGGGNVLIGTTTDSGQGKLQVNGRVYGDGFRSSSSILGFFKNSTGSFDWEIGSDAFVGTGMYMYNGTNGYVFRLTAAGVLTTSGGGTSDRRTKEDINPINESVLSFINELNPVSFKFINDVNKKTRRGFIAQEVLETSIPDLVLGDGDKQGGTYGLDYDGILALAIKAIQEQQEQIQELKNKLL